MPEKVIAGKKIAESDDLPNSFPIGNSGTVRNFKNCAPPRFYLIRGASSESTKSPTDSEFLDANRAHT